MGTVGSPGTVCDAFNSPLRRRAVMICDRCSAVSDCQYSRVLSAAFSRDLGLAHRRCTSIRPAPDLSGRRPFMPTRYAICHGLSIGLNISVNESSTLLTRYESCGIKRLPRLSFSIKQVAHRKSQGGTLPTTPRETPDGRIGAGRATYAQHAIRAKRSIGQSPGLDPVTW